MKVAGDFEQASNIDLLSISVSVNFNGPSDIYGFEGQVPFALESSSDVDSSTNSSFVKAHRSSYVDLVELQRLRGCEESSNVDCPGDYTTTNLGTSASV